MGITLVNIQKMFNEGWLKPDSKWLDIGTSNLYSAPMPLLKNFISKLGVDMPSDSVLQKISDGAHYDPVSGGRNEAFVCDLMELVGVEYVSIDIAQGYKTRIFDLNHETLPLEERNKFDLITNYGTTEHLINQLNAFKVIHDACKVGGIMVHELPMNGYLDHGYFSYTPRFFFDLAHHNSYELDKMYFSTAPSPESVCTIINRFSRYTDAMSFDENHQEAFEEGLASYGIYVGCRKTSEERFNLPLEVATSVGSVEVDYDKFNPVEIMAENEFLKQENQRLKSLLEQKG